MRVHTNSLVEFLTVSTLLYGFHHNVLGCDKRQLLHHSGFNNLRIYHHVAADVDEQVQNTVHCQERFRYGNSLVGRIVQRSFEPLSRSGDCRVQGIDHDITRQRSDSLRTHRVSLVRHCRRTNLVLFERFLHLSEGLKNSHIVGELGCSLSEAGKCGKHVVIHLSGVGLTGNRNASGKSEIFRN